MTVTLHVRRTTGPEPTYYAEVYVDPEQEHESLLSALALKERTKNFSVRGDTAEMAATRAYWHMRELGEPVDRIRVFDLGKD